MALAMSVGLFAVFVANVGMGAFGGAAFLGDVGEMLVLFAAAIAFVATILKREADARRARENDRDQEPGGYNGS